MALQGRAELLNDRVALRRRLDATNESDLVALRDALLEEVSG